MMYRATANRTSDIVPAATTPRAPGNVPFFVDNIWEWLRPEGFPSRRLSAFAAPRADEAAASASCALDQVYSVELLDDQAVCQLVKGTRPDDARYHADIDRLKRQVIKTLPREWYQRPFSERGVEAVLFVPCVSRDEMKMVMQESRLIDAELIRRSSTFWQDVVLLKKVQVTQELHPSGEIFFEGSYRLV